MCAQALAIAQQMRDFPGGASALAASVTAGAEAMRPLRWPAERLDTLGGYLTYHNIGLFNLLLAVYGAIVGAKALRGDEERHAVEELLATGVSRRRLLLARTGGFGIVTVIVSAGLAIGTAVGMGGGGEPDLAGALITCATTGLIAMMGFSVGVLVGQVAREARAAAGLASLLLLGLYLATNLDGQVAGASVLAAVSPFTLANRSRALVPGYGLDLWATLALILAALALLSAAAAANDRRDYDAPLWRRRTAPMHTHAPVPRFMLGSVPTAMLRRGAVGLGVWTVATAAFTAMIAALEPDVVDMWSSMGYLSTFGGQAGVEASYWTFTTSLLPAALAAYVVSQTSGWVNDLQQGRVEMIRATPTSWTRLITGRLVALLAGATLITAVATAALAAVATTVASPLDAANAGRVAVTSVLFAAAMSALAALVCVMARRPAAVILLALLVGTSYLLTYLVPLFGWPDWLNKLSLFWAFGTPYVQWPSTAQMTTLLATAIAGSALAIVVAERSPSVP